MNGLSVVSEIANQYENRNVVTSPNKGNGNGINGNTIMCYNCRGVGHYARNCTVKPRKRDAAYLQQQLQIAQEEEVGIQSTQVEFKFMAAADASEETERVKANCILENNLQQASTSSTQSNKAPVYDSDGSAELRAQLFDKVSKQKDTTRETSANTKFAKQSILGKLPSFSRPKLYAVTPLPKFTAFPKIGEMNALSNQVTSNSVPSPQESNVVKNDNVLSLRIFRMNLFKDYRVDSFVPNKHVKASVRIKPITVSQPHVITKNNVNYKKNGFSHKDVKSTAKTRRPLPRNNLKNDTVLSKSKSSLLSNNLEKLEENHRNLQSSLNHKHMSSECNNIKLDI
nr:hypothetical protein [Tanacetum cinerariifolium]